MDRSTQARPAFARLGPAVLLLYQFVFLNVILPGHTRGVVTLDGKHSGCPFCCCGEKSGKDSHGAPSQRDRDNCALCNFAARLTVVISPSLGLTDFHLLEILRPAPAPAVVVSAPVRIDCCRGPPASIA